MYTLYVLVVFTSCMYYFYVYVLVMFTSCMYWLYVLIIITCCMYQLYVQGVYASYVLVVCTSVCASCMN